jgi:peptidoglycan-associated lipoprotein
MKAPKQDGTLSPGKFVLEGLACFLGSIAALCSLGATACAHKPAETTVVRAAQRTPVVVKVPPAEPSPAAAPTPQEDLEAILAGAVLQFEFDRAILSAESTQRLERIGAALRAHPAARVKIAGHCDERGTQEYNVTLGQQRAEAARAYLIALGIDGKRIETVSYGAETPVDPRHGEEAWAKNRRDELTRIR